MRIALCNEVIAAMPFERQCAFARSVGYDAIEIAPFTPPDSDPIPVSDANYQQNVAKAIITALSSWRSHQAAAAGAAK